MYKRTPTSQSVFIFVSSSKYVYMQNMAVYIDLGLYKAPSFTNITVSEVNPFSRGFKKKAVNIFWYFIRSNN